MFVHFRPRRLHTVIALGMLGLSSCGSGDASTASDGDSVADTGMETGMTTETSGGDGDGDGTATGDGDALSNDFDENSGDNLYGGGLDMNNWVGAAIIDPNAGTEVLASGNGNGAITFSDLELNKELGGSVADVTYDVSFFIALDDPGSMAVEFTDFTRLQIGGPGGSMVWVDTPTPATAGEWVEWSGTYTPAPSDVGGAFSFHAIFDLDGLHSLALDGPVTATPSP